MDPSREEWFSSLRMKEKRSSLGKSMRWQESGSEKGLQICDYHKKRKNGEEIRVRKEKKEGDRERYDILIW